MRSRNSGKIHVENLHILAVERKNDFSKTKNIFAKNYTTIFRTFGLQNMKVGGKANLGDLSLFV